MIPGQKAQAANFDTGTAKGVFVRSEFDGTKKAGRHPPARHALVEGSRQPHRFHQPGGAGLAQGATRRTHRQEPRPHQVRRDGAGHLRLQDGRRRGPDAAEGANNNPNGVYLSTEAKYFDPGVTAEEMRNRYCVEYHKTVYNDPPRCRRPGEWADLLARAGSTGRRPSRGAGPATTSPISRRPTACRASSSPASPRP